MVEDAESPKKTEGNPEDLTEAKKRFREKYGSGVCRKLYEAGVVTDAEVCKKESEKKIEELSEKWATEWSTKMKKFLGVS